MENLQQIEPKPKPKPKIRKIRIFRLTQKNFAAVGISRNLVDQPYPFNQTILLGFLILMSSLICNLVYTFCKSKTFAEHTQSTYMCSCAAVIIFTLIFVLLNVNEFFNLISGLENLANTS